MIYFQIFLSEIYIQLNQFIRSLYFSRNFECFNKPRLIFSCKNGVMIYKEELIHGLRHHSLLKTIIKCSGKNEFMKSINMIR